MNRGFSFLKKIGHLVKTISIYQQMFKAFLSTILFIFLTGTSFGQFGPRKLGIAVNAVYTTSSEIFLNPNASNVEIRNKSFTLKNIWNPGLDLRYRLTKQFILGLNVEYIKKTASANFDYIDSNKVVTLQPETGFELVPFELTAYYYFPFSTEDFKFLMGGGVGYYWGRFIRKFDVAEASVAKRKIAVGIQVSASMDYMIRKNVSARFEMKFRDMQYNVRSRYVEYQDNILNLPEGEFETKVDVNGLTFSLGMVVNL